MALLVSDGDLVDSSRLRDDGGEVLGGVEGVRVGSLGEGPNVSSVGLVRVGEDVVALDGEALLLGGHDG
jgi:hypothetical protein